MPDIDVSQGYKAFRDVLVQILPGVKIKGGYRNVAQPVERDELGQPKETYLVLMGIPVSQSQGRADVSAWTEDSPGSTTGSQTVREDYTGIYELHQVGGRGELIQKVKLSLEMDSFIAKMSLAGLACLRHGPTMPTYSEVNKKWGPDCMSEFTLAASYRLTETNNKITDVKYTLNDN